MAIPFFGEYQPDRNNNSGSATSSAGSSGHSNNHQQAQQSVSRNNNNSLDVNNNINRALVLDNEDEQIGFLSQLIRELLIVYNNYTRQQRPAASNMQSGRDGGSSTSGSGSNNPRVLLQQEQNPRRISDQNQQQDNQPEGPSLPSRLASSRLPDIISCHVSTSLRINSSTPRPLTTGHPTVNHPDLVNDETEEDELRVRGHPEESDHYSSSSDDDDGQFRLNFKMEVEYTYRQIGRDLRHIADNYEHENVGRVQGGGRRQRQTRITSTRTTFKLDLALKVAIPVTLVAVGLASLFRGRYL